MHYISHPILPDFYLPVNSETTQGIGVYPYYKAMNTSSITVDFVSTKRLKGVHVHENDILVRAVTGEEHNSSGMSKWILNAKRTNAAIHLLQTNPQSIRGDILDTYSEGNGYDVTPELQQGTVTSTLLWADSKPVDSTQQGSNSNPWIRRFHRTPIKDRIFDVDQQYHQLPNTGQWNEMELQDTLPNIDPKFEAHVSNDGRWLYVKAVGTVRSDSDSCIRTFEADLTCAFANLLTKPIEFRALVVTSTGEDFERAILMKYTGNVLNISPVPLDGVWKIDYNLTTVSFETNMMDYECSEENQEPMLYNHQPIPPPVYINNQIVMPTPEPKPETTTMRPVISYPNYEVPSTFQPIRETPTTYSSETTTTTTTAPPKSNSWVTWMIVACSCSLIIAAAIYWFKYINDDTAIENQPSSVETVPTPNQSLPVQSPTNPYTPNIPAKPSFDLYSQNTTPNQSLPVQSPLTPYTPYIPAQPSFDFYSQNAQNFPSLNPIGPRANQIPYRR